MAYKGQTAFITGGASGIARALAQRLVDGGARVFIADINIDGAQDFVSDLNQSQQNTAYCARCDVNSWEELTSALTQALNTFDRIDYVFPIAGLTERQVIPRPSEQRNVRKEGFIKPDNTVLETNLMGMVNLIMITVQAFRGQEPRAELGGMRGKIVCVASTCGLYNILGVPVYTASKQGMVGLTRNYGAILPYEKITLNAICPHIVRTAISKSVGFYEDLENRGLLTDINNVVTGFETFLGTSQSSGDCLEVGPKGSRIVGPAEYMDEETRLGCEAVMARSGRLWQD